MIKVKQINLIPKELLKKSLPDLAKELFNRDKRLRNVIILVGAVIFITFFQLAAIGILKLSLNFYNSKVKQAKLKLNRLQSQALELEKQKNELNKEESLKKEHLDQLLSTTSANKSYAELFEFIAGLAPQELWIKQFSVTEQEIQIVGTTLDPQLIIQFMNQLDESGSFRGSFFTSSEKEVVESHTVYNFQITTIPIWDALRNKD